LSLAYGTAAGEAIRDWLVKNAAYTADPSAETELGAFAEKFAAPFAATPARTTFFKFGNRWGAKREQKCLTPRKKCLTKEIDFV
jgi:hypothetical protein